MKETTRSFETDQTVNGLIDTVFLPGGSAPHSNIRYEDDFSPQFLTHRMRR